ncbi:DNA glycosylase AlkZ-like family protein [Nocardioides aurantiacus]|uniref:Winged helix DNA-binding protein n=1 Tax=Nocardioides aurantiacus TaxID=86796 RepID=A0A3N2CXC0_9ACTN|nr:crosslink repair DNA glycosylase YcaQ family protein [Nocardioides aurantiacus]ROR92149.1 winged helix DNA-binding protein [Nocardioides aurantiacus]
MELTREQVLRHRVHVQQLDRPGTHSDAAVLDLGVQDTGTDGAGWALALRGCEPDPAALVTAWTLRGAPHVHRRAQVAEVATAVAPWSEADAGKRIFDAARPLRAAGLEVRGALARVAEEMADVVQQPTVKGALSAELGRRLPPPYLRWCRPCDAEHVHEQTFRLAALQAGLELRPGTSPPVLEPVPGWSGPADDPDPALDPVRAALHLLGPTTPQLVAAYVDAPVAEVRRRWPGDVVEVSVAGERRWALEADRDALADPPSGGAVRLLAPFDLHLQARDRDLLVPDEAVRKDVWRTLGRPGAVLVGHELQGSWRPRASGGVLRLLVEEWAPLPDRTDLAEQAERLAAHRGLRFGGFVDR